MKNRQNDKVKNTFQVRIDIKWREILTVIRGKTGKTIKELTEQSLEETYEENKVKSNGVYTHK